MKRNFILLLIIILSCVPLCFGQGNDGKATAIDTAFNQGSNIVFPELTDQLSENLDLLGRVWGFLKYHHPTIAQGKYNWDYELFRMLPGYLQAQSPKERDAYLVKWIRHYGKIPINKEVVPVDSNAVLKPDLAWINLEDLSPKLYELLMKVYQNRWQKNNYYVFADIIRGGNVKFLHEESYADMYYPDAGFRLLALYRYWNMVQYFFPYRNLTDTDWNLVMKECLPLLLDASDKDSYFYAIKQLVSKCDDSHGMVFRDHHIANNKVTKDVPFKVQFLQNDTLVVTKYLNPENVLESYPHIGDVITHINGKSISQIIDSLIPFYAASNRRTFLRDIAYNIMRGDSDFVVITFFTTNGIQKSTIRRYPTNMINYDEYWGSNNRYYQTVKDSIGYVSMNNLNDSVQNSLLDTLRKKQSVILDFRKGKSDCNDFFLSKFLSTEIVPYCVFSHPIICNPGEFLRNKFVYLSKGETFNNKSIVLLVNEYAQSAAEYSIMQYQACHNHLVIGTPTAGADGDVTSITLPGGIQTYFSGLGVYYPDGTETQRVGIIPDIYVWPTVQGIREGRDEILEKALEILSK